MVVGNVDIAALILRFCSSGLTKSELCKKSNLDITELDQHLDSLFAKDLVKEQSDRSGKHSILHTAEKGIRFLDLYDSIRMKYLTIRSSSRK